MPLPNPEILCDFSPPEIRLSAYISREDGRSLDAHLIDIEQSDDGWGRLRQAVESVREAVRFVRDGPDPWFEKDTGDCRTFTWLVSDMAEAIGFKSYVVYCNGHVFNVVRSSDGEMHVVNAETPHLWFEKADSNAATYDLFDRETWQFLKSDQYPNTYKIVGLYGVGIRVAHEKSLNYERSPTELVWLKANHLAATIMDPTTAKRGIFAQSCLDHQLVSDSPAYAVLTTLYALGESCNPEVETRSSVNPRHRLMESRVKQWISEGTPTETIVECVLAFKRIMPDTKSSRVRTGDLLRLIGQRRSEKSLIESAEREYLRAADMNPKPDLTLRGKIGKARSLLGRLATRTSS